MVGAAMNVVLWDEPYYLWLALVDVSLGILFACLLLFFGVTVILRKLGMRYMKGG
jgi:hypothetical protein